MYCVKKVKEDLFWVGGTDRRLALFENAYPIPRGVSYNAYVLLDEKTVLFDTVDWAVAGQLYENLAKVLDGRPLDYIVVDHMEQTMRNLRTDRRKASGSKDRMQCKDSWYYQAVF